MASYPYVTVHGNTESDYHYDVQFTVLDERGLLDPSIIAAAVSDYIQSVYSDTTPSKQKLDQVTSTTNL